MQPDEPYSMTTPVKPERESCAICSASVKKLFSLNNFTCRRLNAATKLERMANFSTGFLQDFYTELYSPGFK